MLRPLLTRVSLVAALSAGLAACGSSDEPTAVVGAPQLTGEQAAPSASTVSGLLGTLAEVPEAHGRLAYVAPKALDEITAPLSAAELRRIVLGTAGAQRAAAAEARAIAQVGPATVIVDPAGARRVEGGAADLRASLTSTTPPTSVIAPETASALQSCLGEPAAEVIRGSDVLGPTSGAGVSLLDDADAPAGPKLRICAAPHYVRDLVAIERRLHARFPSGEVLEDEIGEREIVWAVVPLDSLAAGELRELLAGGSALLELARG